MSKNCSEKSAKPIFDFRAIMDVEKAMEAVAWMKQCIRDSHKITEQVEKMHDRRAEQVEKLELLNKHITEQMHDAVALIGDSVGLALLNRLSQRRCNANRARESGGGAGRPVGWHPTPIPAPHACPHAPLPAPRGKILKKDSTNYHSLKRRFKQLAVSMASCGYSWVMASRGDGAWVPGNEIGKLEDLPPREQGGSRSVALARTW
jgi:hypothetical protein